MEKIQHCLSGELGVKEDQFGLFVNTEAAKLVQQIEDQLAKLNLPLVRKWYWPKGAKACCVLTHDIDWLEYSPYHKAVLNRELGLAHATRLLLGNLFIRKNYGWNIPEMIDMEKGFGCKSTFFLRTEYADREKKLVDSSVELLKKQEFEIGLHASHSSHKTSEALKSELSEFRRLFGETPLGIRYHILRFLAPSTWKVEMGEGIQYDATFAYNEYFGFRSEVCFPYHPFATGERLAITELPTSFMDWTLLHRKVRGHSAESTLQRVKESIEKYNGVLTVNFHNTYINQNTFPDIFALYKSLLKQVASENYWVATASECVKWWNERAFASPKPRIMSSDEIVAVQTPAQLAASGSKKFSIRYESSY
ncbi:MAG: hypothetical protein ACREBS_03980 [Nitrososphaerales archaeon]